EDHQLAVFPYLSLAKGFLAGKYRDASQASSPGASVHAECALSFLDARGRAVLAELDAIAAAHGVEVASVSLAWVRQQPTITAPLASASRLEQVAPLLASLSLTLSDDEIARLNAAS